jgi:hypothetical protein
MNKRQRRIRTVASKFDAGWFVRISKCQFTNGAEQNYGQETIRINNSHPQHTAPMFKQNIN